MPDNHEMLKLEHVSRRTTQASNTQTAAGIIQNRKEMPDNHEMLNLEHVLRRTTQEENTLKDTSEASDDTSGSRRTAETGIRESDKSSGTPAITNWELISNKSPAYLKNLLADIQKDLIDLAYIKNYNQEFLIDLAYIKTKK
jgi:hypothetical protein